MKTPDKIVIGTFLVMLTITTLVTYSYLSSNKPEPELVFTYDEIEFPFNETYFWGTVKSIGENTFIENWFLQFRGNRRGETVGEVDPRLCNVNVAILKITFSNLTLEGDIEEKLIEENGEIIVLVTDETKKDLVHAYGTAKVKYTFTYKYC